jgi:branched-chain amino acid transport system substrate-binding protein
MGRLVSAGTILVASAMVSCSFSQFVFTECELNSECQDAFGWGHICADALCAPVRPNPRCSETYPSDLLLNPGRYPELTVIGIQFNQEEYESISLGAQFAMSELLEQTGLGDGHFGVVVCDTSASSLYDNLSQEQANEMVAEYLADKVGAVAIIGPATSDAAERAYRKAERHGTLVMSPSATGIFLTEVDGTTSSYSDPGLLWRTCGSDATQSQKLVDLMDGDSVSTAAIIYETSNYGSPFAQQIKLDAKEQHDIEVVLKPYDRDSIENLQEMMGQVLGVPDTDTPSSTLNVDAVVFISGVGEHTRLFLETVAQTDADDGSGALVYLTDGAKDEALFEGIGAYGSITDRLKGTYPASGEGEVYDIFADTIDASFGTGFSRSKYVEHSYDAAWLVAYGAAWSYHKEGEITGIGIARGLRQVSNKNSGETIPISGSSWSTVRAKFAEVTPIDVRGASGELDYDPNTGETQTDILVWCVSMEGDQAVIGACSEG